MIRLRIHPSRKAWRRLRLFREGGFWELMPGVLHLHPGGRGGVVSHGLSPFGEVLID
jgi:hypothetical protein